MVARLVRWVQQPRECFQGAHDQINNIPDDAKPDGWSDALKRRGRTEKTNGQILSDTQEAGSTWFRFNFNHSILISHVKQVRCFRILADERHVVSCEANLLCKAAGGVGLYTQQGVRPRILWMLSWPWPFSCCIKLHVAFRFVSAWDATCCNWGVDCTLSLIFLECLDNLMLLNSSRRQIPWLLWICDMLYSILGCTTLGNGACRLWAFKWWTSWMSANCSHIMSTRHIPNLDRVTAC